MYLVIFNKQYGIDSIEYAGNVLEAFIYDMDASDRENSIAIPVMTKKQIEAYMTAQGRHVEELEDFVAWDYFILLNRQIRDAIEAKYDGLRFKAKLSLYTLFALFALSHIIIAVMIWLAPWWSSPAAYLILMMLCLNYARTKHLIN